jgi:HEAT repeat protein
MHSAPPPDQPADWLLRRRRLDSILRLQAAAVIGDPAHQEAIQVLTEALGDPVADVREIAVCALHEYGAEARHALPALIRATQDESPIVRRRALRAVPEIADPGDPNTDVIPVLLAATEDSDEGVVAQAVASLGEFGPAAAPALPALMAALWTGDARRRALVGVALTRIGAAAVPGVTQALLHPSADVRAKAAQVLGRIGPGDQVRPALEPLLKDPDAGVRDTVNAVLSSI